MLSAVTTKFRNIIGISSSKPDTRKRSLEEESEDDISGDGEGEPATKKRCRPHTERDEPMIKRSYNRLYKIFREGFSGVCSLASNFTLRSNSELVMVDTSPSKNNRIKVTVSSKPSSSKIDRAQGGSNEVGYSRTAESPRTTRFNHLSRKMSSDDDIQLIEVRGQGDQSDQPTRRPALARRLPSPGSTQSSSPSINPSFQFTPTISPIPSQSTSDVKARPTIKEPIKLKNSEDIQKVPFINRKCGYVTRNPVRGVHDRFLGTRMKMRTLSQSGRGSSSAEESFRYEDKVRYRQLLQQFTSSSVLPSSYSVYRAPSRSSNVSNSSSSLGLVSRSRCNYIWTQEKRRQLEESLRASTSSSRPLLEGTDSGVSEPTTSKMTKDIPVIDLARTESTNSVQSANDSDKESVIFVEEVIQPSSRKNSLEEILQSSPVFQNSWYKDLRKEYDLRSKISQKEVELATQLKKSLTERRIVQQASLDDRLSRRMKFLDLTFPSKVEEIQPEEEPEEFIPLTSEMEVNLVLGCFHTTRYHRQRFNGLGSQLWVWMYVLGLLY
nr:uncharacterized protein LOC123749652 isoform X1 [Procambarus clarkii]